MVQKSNEELMPLEVVSKEKSHLGVKEICAIYYNSYTRQTPSQ